MDARSITLKISGSKQDREVIIGAATTIKELKRNICTTHLIPVDDQRLIFKGKVLKDSDPIPESREIALVLYPSSSTRELLSSDPSPVVHTPSAAPAEEQRESASESSSFPSIFPFILTRGVPTGFPSGIMEKLFAVPGCSSKESTERDTATESTGSGIQQFFSQIYQSSAQAIQNSAQAISAMATPILQQLAELTESNPPTETPLACPQQVETQRTEEQQFPPESLAPSNEASECEGQLFKDEMQLIREMGFDNEAAIVDALTNTSGNVPLAIERLLASS